MSMGLFKWLLILALAWGGYQYFSGGRGAAGASRGALEGTTKNGHQKFE
jgi:hypothetical protein